jgi:hypothetical protein
MTPPFSWITTISPNHHPRKYPRGRILRLHEAIKFGGWQFSGFTWSYAILSHLGLLVDLMGNYDGSTKGLLLEMPTKARPHVTFTFPNIIACCRTL